MFAEGEDLRQLPLAERKARLRDILDSQSKRSAGQIRYLEHIETSGAA